MADRVGQQLGNYRLIRLLGRGGFAEVYLGEHLRLGTQAAIKILYTRLAGKDDIEGFEKEARTIAHLRHPHIVRVFDYDVEEDIPFLVMDYASGGTLRKRHPRGTILSLATIISYIKQVADALQYAHDQRVIHRDVKPENMLIGERDELLLSDFGIAITAQSSRYQSTQNMGGTMAYIAPEQIQGHPRTASDQYSLGIVVYEWLSGNCPFRGSMTEIVAQHLAVPPPPLHEKVPTILPDLEQVVLTALAKDPKQRFVSVRAFATALEQASQSVQPASSVVTPPLRQLPQPKVGVPSPGQSSSPPGTVVATPFSQVSQATDGVTPQSQSALLAEVVTPLGQPGQASVATPPPTTLITPTAPVQTALTSPDGSQLPKRRLSRRAVVFGLAGLALAGGGITWLALSQRLDVSSPSFHPPATPSPTPSPTPPPLGTTLLTYTGHSKDVFAVAWSPDGKRIASGSGDSTVQVWDASTGTNVYTYRGHSLGVDALAWSPDGKRIASGSGDYTVQVWDATTGGNVLTYTGHSNGVGTVAWSPNGKYIASGSGSSNRISDNTVQVWDASTGTNVFTYRGHGANTVGWSGITTVAWSPNSRRIASGSEDSTVHVWDATTGGNVFIYKIHSIYAVDAVAWSPDGKRIACGCEDHTVQVWDAADGSNVYTYLGHSSVVDAVAWSPDGKRIASSSYDPFVKTENKVQVWDAADGGHVFTYRGYGAETADMAGIYAVAWSPDGERIASGGADHTVKVWQAR